MAAVIAAVAVAVAAGAIWAMTLAPQPVGTADSAGDAGGAASPAPSASSFAEPTPVDGSEVLPPQDTETAAGRLPALSAATPRVAPPLPADAATPGALAEGFPSDLAGPTPRSEVIDSSLAGDGTALQAAMTARTDEATDAVTAFFRERWTALGLAPVAGTDALAFADAYTSVTLATAATGTGTVYTVAATLRTE